MPAATNWKDMGVYQVALQRVKSAGGKINDGVNILKKMEDRAIINFDDLIWPMDAGAIIPDRQTLMDSLCEEDINGNTAISLVFVCEDGRARKLFMGSLRKSVVPYKAAGAGFMVDQSQPVCVSDTPFYNEVMNCANEKEVFDLIASKEGQRLFVSDVKTCQTAKMNFADRNNPVPTGLKKASVACFKVEPIA